MDNSDFLQELSAGIDTTQSATNRTKQYDSDIASNSVLIASFSTYAANPALITVEDDKANVWALIGRAFDATSGRGCAGYICRANAGSIGSGNRPTITFNKNGANCYLGGSILEVSDVHADLFDTTTVTDDDVSTGPAQVTLGTTAFTDDAIMAILCTPGTSWVTATPNAGYTDAVANTFSGVVQHKVQKRLVTAAGVYTPGWTLNNSSQWAVVGFALKGSTTLPTITSVSSATPRKNSTLTIYGINFGASAGTVDLEGTAITPSAWADDEIQIPVSEGLNKFGVPVALTITTSAAIESNTYEGITELLPQTGWDYVDLITPDIFTAHRLTALGDLESGDQVSWNTASGLVNVSNTAVPDADPSVTSFSARAWTPGSGWGSSATQTISTDDYEPPDDTIIVGGHKPIATLELPGIFSANYRVKWSNILNGEKSAPVSLSGVTSLSVQALGTFGDEGYVAFEGSDDGVTYDALVDESEDPILFSAAGTATSDDVKVYMRPDEPVGDGDTDLTVILIAN